jgi:hypothetical protein
MLQDGEAEVVRVTECSATVRYVAGRVTEFVRPLSGEVVRFAAAGRTVTISPHSEVEIIHRAALELESQTPEDVERDRRQAETRQAIADRLQRPLKGDGSGIARMMTGDLFGDGELFAPRGRGKEIRK